MPPISCTSKWPQTERAARRLADHRERLGQQVVERLARRELLAELHGLRGQVGIAELLQLGLEGIDAAHDADVLGDQALVAAAEDPGKPVGH